MAELTPEQQARHALGCGGPAGHPPEPKRIVVADEPRALAGFPAAKPK
jgi:hypothetical protein